ncbi:MAG: CoB--CoM heterodisulfide reductase iron-sulfur subunit A family protein, partial [Desulfobacteraceae bacterium]
MVTLSEVTGIKGEAGNFTVELLQKPRYVDTDKCIACGACTEKCPSKVDNQYNAGLSKRKAIYVEYPQAVPLKYAIDAERCIFLTKGKCGSCKKKCPVDAIDYDQKEKQITLNVGSLILAPGFEPFNPKGMDNYQYASYPNVITSLEFERILSASGPTGGHVVRPSDHKEPKKIAWFQCVGSRDQNKCDNSYCSSVCCMYAIKEAVIAKEHAGDELDCSIFFMDMRTPGKEFERFYENAKKKSGVNFIRSRVHTINPVGDTGDLELRYVTEDGELKVDVFDMVVLSIGLQTPPALVDLAGKL